MTNITFKTQLSVTSKGNYMSVQTQDTQQPNQAQEQKTSDKELNFRALEAKYQKALETQQKENERLQRELQSKSQITSVEDEDGDDYVDTKKLNKKLSNFERNMEEKIEKKAEEKARNLLEKDRKDKVIFKRTKNKLKVARIKRETENRGRHLVP